MANPSTRPTTVPIAQYEAAQDALMKALLGAFTKNSTYLRMGLDKAVANNVVKLTEDEEGQKITAVEWGAQ
ncbi:hypothetical protein [Tardiphaga sp.]|jgi:hypothetical protein|uniref:hypothetical protein n=1 Tax=Tardiphaga sp. TaxID=1926292 RepID=UPI0037DA7313